MIGEEMSNTIIYKRVMKLTYEAENLNKDELAFLLQEKGINMTDCWETEKTEYGFNAKEITTESHVILNSAGRVVVSCDYDFQRNKIFEQIKHFWKVTKDCRTTTEISEVWEEAVGDRLVLDEELSTANNVVYGTHSSNHRYSDTLGMGVTLTYMAWYNKIELVFTIRWRVDRVQPADLIEDKVVETPLKDMSTIQAKVEDVLKTLELDVSTPLIDCTFEAITNSKSECTPETIGKLREMKNSKREVSDEEDEEERLKKKKHMLAESQ